VADDELEEVLALAEEEELCASLLLLSVLEHAANASKSEPDTSTLVSARRADRFVVGIVNLTSVTGITP
jgi:hypothetical protein